VSVNVAHAATRRAPALVTDLPRFFSYLPFSRFRLKIFGGKRLRRFGGSLTAPLSF
jgi:hypothetical protein